MMGSPAYEACPFCMSHEIEYEGVSDGAGDYGTSVCDIFHCLNCDGSWEGACMDEFKDGE